MIKVRTNGTMQAALPGMVMSFELDDVNVVCTFQRLHKNLRLSMSPYDFIETDKAREPSSVT